MSNSFYIQEWRDILQALEKLGGHPIVPQLSTVRGGTQGEDPLI